MLRGIDGLAHGQDVARDAGGGFVVHHAHCLDRMRLVRLQALRRLEAKYGKPILDRVIVSTTTPMDAAKCVLVSFDSTMRSNLSVAMPIDLLCYERDALEVRKRRRFAEGDPYFGALSKQWSDGVREVFKHLPEPDWQG